MQWAFPISVRLRPSLSVVDDRFAIHSYGADVAAFQLGTPHAGLHPLHDQRPFQLRNG
jgi:hypothetical protein